MHALRILLPLTVALALLPLISADHCETYHSSSPELTVDTLGLRPTLYIEHNYCQLCGMPSMWPWIYEESNGIDGLQRGDEVVDDTCHGSIRPDTLIL